MQEAWAAATLAPLPTLSFHVFYGETHTRIYTIAAWRTGYTGSIQKSVTWANGALKFLKKDKQSPAGTEVPLQKSQLRYLALSTLSESPARGSLRADPLPWLLANLLAFPVHAENSLAEASSVLEVFANHTCFS